MASGKEGGGRRKRGRTPDEPRKGKDKAKASPDADLCPICWEKPAGFVGIPECGHRFCFNCISKWATEEATVCPVCRKDVLYAWKILEGDDAEQKNEACQPERVPFQRRLQPVPHEVDRPVAEGQEDGDLAVEQVAEEFGLAIAQAAEHLGLDLAQVVHAMGLDLGEGPAEEGDSDPEEAEEEAEDDAGLDLEEGPDESDLDLDEVAELVGLEVEEIEAHLGLDAEQAQHDPDFDMFVGAYLDARMEDARVEDARVEEAQAAMARSRQAMRNLRDNPGPIGDYRGEEAELQPEPELPSDSPAVNASARWPIVGLEHAPGASPAPSEEDIYPRYSPEWVPALGIPPQPVNVPPADPVNPLDALDPVDPLDALDPIQVRAVREHVFMPTVLTARAAAATASAMAR
eukprot:jgi/Undpi1/11684/HiC_scaffold_36.g13979.m1